MSTTQGLEGACHCGAIGVKLTLIRPAPEIELRACQCTFCRRHGGLTVSDPAGRALFEITDPDLLTRYRFGPATADFLICARCGVYAGAVLEDGDGAWSVVNVAGLAIPGFEGRSPARADYDAETRQGRIARRKTKWTPTEISFRSPGETP